MIDDNTKNPSAADYSQSTKDFFKMLSADIAEVHADIKRAGMDKDTADKYIHQRAGELSEKYRNNSPSAAGEIAEKISNHQP